MFLISRQSSLRRARLARQSLDELSFLDCRNLRLPHRRRTELPRESYSDITNVNSIPPYLIANAAFGYEARHWGIDVNVHNITNERYFIAANAGAALVGQPLSAIVTLHASF
jgi:outer membrane receptor protein involved in Fe transport